MTTKIIFGSVVDMEPRYSLWMIFPQKLLLSEHAHDRRIHPLCTGIPKWLCCTFFQTTQIESKRKNNPLCRSSWPLLSSDNPLAAYRERYSYSVYLPPTSNQGIFNFTNPKIEDMVVHKWFRFMKTIITRFIREIHSQSFDANSRNGIFVTCTFSGNSCGEVKFRFLA